MILIAFFTKSYFKIDFCKISNISYEYVSVMTLILSQHYDSSGNTGKMYCILKMIIKTA